MEQTIKDIIINYSNGNLGAMNFLIGLMKEPLIHSYEVIDKCKIKGTNLWVLFSDLGNKDYTNVQMICSKVPDKVLIDACNRQDYSGIALIKPYLE